MRFDHLCRNTAFGQTLRLFRFRSSHSTKPGHLLHTHLKVFRHQPCQLIKVQSALALSHRHRRRESRNLRCFRSRSRKQVALHRGIRHLRLRCGNFGGFRIIARQFCHSIRMSLLLFFRRPFASHLSRFLTGRSSASARLHGWHIRHGLTRRRFHRSTDGHFRLDFLHIETDSIHPSRKITEQQRLLHEIPTIREGRNQFQSLFHRLDVSRLPRITQRTQHGQFLVRPMGEVREPCHLLVGRHHFVIFLIFHNKY